MAPPRIPFHEFFDKITFPKDDENFAEFYSDGKALDSLNSISQINIFVGPNNSGKSLLARSILGIEKLKPVFSQLNEQKIQNCDQFLFESFTKHLERNKWTRIRMSDGNIMTTKQVERKLKWRGPNEEDVSLYSNRIDEFIGELIVSTSHLGTDTGRSLQVQGQIAEDFKSVLNDIQKKKNEFLGNFIVPNNYSRLYCPTIRTLRNYQSADLLAKKSYSEYGFEEAVKIQNGQDLYNAFDELVRSDYESEQKKLAFEEFLSLNFFDGQRVIIRPTKDKKEVAIKVGKEKERPIYHLGEGLQTIIMLTFPLFRYDAGIIVIEEPETYIHPGLQRKLMDIFANHERSRNFLFLLTTHSNHILDAANFSDKMSVYAVKKRPDSSDSHSQVATFDISSLSNGDKSALNLLGVSNTSVYLANCTIWVEGVTDMMYLRKYIECFINGIDSKSQDAATFKKLKEGIHYAFILSGGDNLVHFDFDDKNNIESLKNQVVVRNICGRAMVVVDDDHKKNKTRKERFFKELGGHFYVLPVVEIENLLSNEAIVGAINSFKSCEGISIPESNYLTEKEYSKMRLGTYIEDHLFDKVPRRNRKKFRATTSPPDNATINSKLEFCTAALDHIEYETMSDSSKKVVKQILNFIIDHNSAL